MRVLSKAVQMAVPTVLLKAVHWADDWVEMLVEMLAAQ